MCTRDGYVPARIRTSDGYVPVLVMGTYMLPLYNVLVMGTYMLPLYGVLEASRPAYRRTIRLLSEYDWLAIGVRSAFGVWCL